MTLFVTNAVIDCRYPVVTGSRLGEQMEATSPKRQAVIVLGMHRSGTSALAGALVRCGFASPRTPLPAAPDNPAGFFESQLVVGLNHAILVAMRCAWNVCLTLDPDRIPPMLSARDRLTIKTTLQAEFPDRRSFVLKDPRLCLTLPAWLSALEDHETEPRALIIVRHPREVVNSLRHRNGLGEYDTAPHWLHHVLEAERLTRGMGRAVVLYADLVRSGPRCLTEAAWAAGIKLPRPPDQDDPHGDNALAGAVRHYDAGDTSAALGPAPVRDLVDAGWTALRTLAIDQTASCAQGRLDQVRARFADWRRAAFPPDFHAVLPTETGSVGTGSLAVMASLAL
jgi:hypothetical protein